MEHCRSRARFASLFTMLIATAIALAALAVPAQAASSDSTLGTKTPAKGTPVKIGFITDGKTSGTDNTIEQPVTEAAVKWINQYRNGIGGHPIELDTCVTGGDPSKSVDCANQMIQDDVAAVVIGANQFTLNSWTPLHDAGIPLYASGIGNPTLLADNASTFSFQAGPTAFENLIIGAAKAQKTKKVSAVVIDVPAATQILDDKTPYKKAGIDLQVTPVALGTADMTPQMQKIVTENPKGEVFVLGNDSFCIAAFNGLRTAGFKGQVTAIPNCLSDATRTAVPADALKGIKITASQPIDTPNDPSMKQYAAVLKKFGASDVDTTRTTGAAMFQGITGLNVATQNLKGEATPATIIAATKAMPWSVLPASGGFHIRCNGKASPATPANCTNAGLSATLNGQGKASKYVVIGDTQIPA